MKRFSAQRTLFILFLLTAVTGVGSFFIGCSAPTIESTWPKKVITADGKIDDWEGLINYSLADQFGIGVANDDRFIYLCAVIEDRKTAMQALHSGLTLWFQTTGSKDKRLGINFPIGTGSFRELHRSQDREEDTAELRERIEGACQQVDILGPGKHDSLLRNITLCEPYGIQLKFTRLHEDFIYEARIPLFPDSLMTYAVNPGKDSLVTIKIECPAPEFAGTGHEGSSDEGGGERGGRGGGMGGGGMGGGHGGGMGHGGMGGGGHHQQQAQPIDVKLIIKLAGRSAK